jgi:hypothetical protein
MALGSFFPNRLQPYPPELLPSKKVGFVLQEFVLLGLKEGPVTENLWWHQCKIGKLTYNDFQGGNS